MAKQITSTLPLGEYVVIDDGPAGNYAGNGTTLGSVTAGAPGYDTTGGGALTGTQTQDTNPYANGTVFLDYGTNAARYDASNATNQTTYKTVTKLTIGTVVSDLIFWQNPA
jgi:hypothetical protein